MLGCGPSDAMVSAVALQMIPDERELKLADPGEGGGCPGARGANKARNMEGRRGPGDWSQQ